jgi:hypothetical protein
VQNTYTYIARSMENPMRVATLTLHEDRMSIGIGAPIEQISAFLQDEAEEFEEGTENVETQSPWLRPLIISLIERRSTPFHIRDVEVSRSNGGLIVRAWSRVAGLRLFPVIMTWRQVDNPAAAEDFVREVNERKQVASPVRKFIGFLDYWATWAVGAVALLFMISQQRGRRA